jgi:glyoxylase-like metal-dependent hydrolase (beta-lactamase superfamily II)
MDPIPIHAHNPGPITGDGNWTYLLTGRVPTLIDAGTGDARHLDGVVEALGGARLAQVLVTHAHGDHASGALAVRDRFPGVRFRKMPWPGRDAKWPVDWDPIVPGERIQAGDALLTAVHTPGHAPDHLCLWDEAPRVLYCGDLAQSGNSVWIPFDLRGDLADYLDSLALVLDMRPARLLPSHGPVIEAPEPLLRRYIEHRLARERQIVDVMRDGASTPEEITRIVYAALPEKMQSMAKQGVLSHLAKLAREGRVRLDGDAWNIMSA